MDLHLTHTKVRASTSRLGYLDWMRGVAAVAMLQGHVFHSFTGKQWREGSAYTLSQFFGGMPPALFLFLTGVTLAFLMDSSEKKALPPLERVIVALRRSAYLFSLAYLFRFQLWLFGWPNSPWTDLLKVDILNCMGLGMASMAVMSVFSTFQRARYSTVLGLLIACASPVVSSLDWSGAPGIIRSYLIPDVNYFSFFPWASFLAFGVAAGSLIRIIPPAAGERFMQWSALMGFGLLLGGGFFFNVPYSLYSKSEFWLDSPGLVLMKLGAILLLMALGFVWNEHVIKGRWNWLLQMGTTSLLVYWVHIELVYGRWFWAWKENLTVGQTTLVSVAIIGLMLALSVARTRWSQWSGRLVRSLKLKRAPLPEPARESTQSSP